MRVRREDIGLKPRIIKKETPEKGFSKEKYDAILTAIENIKLDMPAPETHNETEIKQEPPKYHFEVKRNSDGFIESIVASPIVPIASKPSSVTSVWQSKNRKR